MLPNLLASIVALSLALQGPASPTIAVMAPHCTKGYACGGSCISYAKECHVGRGDAVNGAAPESPFSPAPSPNACPPKTTVCAHDVCAPIGVQCPSAGEIAVATGQREVPDPTKQVTRDWDKAPSAQDVPCLEPIEDFNARKTKRTVVFTLIGVGFSLASIVVLLSAREPKPSTRGTWGRKICTSGKPCGDSCIAWDKECHVEGDNSSPQCVNGYLCGNTCIAWDKQCGGGSGSSGGSSYSGGNSTGLENTRPTTGGLVASLVLAVAGLGLMIGGGVSANRMKRRGVACTAKGCTFTLRF